MDTRLTMFVRKDDESERRPARGSGTEGHGAPRPRRLRGRPVFHADWQGEPANDNHIEDDGDE